MMDMSDPLPKRLPSASDRHGGMMSRSLCLHGWALASPSKRLMRPFS